MNQLANYYSILPQRVDWTNKDLHKICINSKKPTNRTRAYLIDVFIQLLIDSIDRA